ncbi:MAG: IS66 family transposase [Steroidobacteraceae bacterium]
MSSSPITSPFAPDLSAVRAWLEKMIAAMKFVELITAIVALFAKMAELNAELTRRLAQSRRKHPRSETLERLGRQQVLPLPGLLAPDVGAAEPTAEADDAPPRKPRRRLRPHPGRAAAPAHLERVAELNPVPAELRICPKCGVEMPTVSHSACETLDVIPAKVIVRVRHDETVACPNDDTIVSAPVPRAIVDRGKLGDTLIVEAVADKYVEHQPIERQCTRFARAGAPIAPQTLGRSVAAALELLAPVARMIVEQTRAPGLLGTDATGLPILDPSMRDGIRTGTMWCWTNARWVSFVYSPRGDSDSVREFLGNNLARTVQCDGTSITSFLERAGGKRPGCWSHGRRRFADAAGSGDLVALEALKIIARLFVVERDATLAGDNADARRARRAEHSKPVLDELRAFVDEHLAVTPPKTPLGQALRYLHRQWRRLVLFLEDGNIELTNNRRERELRRLVLGRRNWLFTWLDEGGERTATILSIVATCIAHEVEPRAYLHRVTRLIVEGWPQSKLRDLLPDRMLVAHPDIFVGERERGSLVSANDSS